MAQFEGTIQEYHDFIDPRIRNKVNNLTRSARLSRNKICEHCGQERELQSAHVHGYERRAIIEKVLSSCKNNEIVSCDLGEVERQILDAHKPIEKTFLFLCQECHKKYDGKKKTSSMNKIKKDVIVSSHVAIKNNEKFLKLERIEIWAMKTQQINHKIICAYLFLERGGKVFLQDLNRICSSSDSKFYVGTNFKGNYASLKTDSGNAHGKVFYDEDGIVYIYAVVREEIKKWFGE